MRAAVRKRPAKEGARSGACNSRATRAQSNDGGRARAKSGPRHLCELGRELEGVKKHNFRERFLRSSVPTPELDSAIISRNLFRPSRRPGPSRPSLPVSPASLLSRPSRPSRPSLSTSPVSPVSPILTPPLNLGEAELHLERACAPTSRQRWLPRGALGGVGLTAFEKRGDEGVHLP